MHTLPSHGNYPPGVVSPPDEDTDDLADTERTIERLLPGSTATIHQASRSDAEFRIVLTATATRCRVDGTLTAKWLLETVGLQCLEAARQL